MFEEERLCTLQLGSGWFPEQSGGLDRVYYELLAWLPRIGVRCDGLVVGSRQVREDLRYSVEAFAPLDASLLKRALNVRSAVRVRAFKDYDVIASHFALYTFPVLDLIGRQPFVVHFHGPWAAESAVEGRRGRNSRIKGLLERAVYRKAGRLIVLSRAFRDILVRDYGIDEDRIRVVPGGVDADRFASLPSRCRARSELQWPDRPTLLSVRRLARRMGLEDLIDAMPAIIQKIPDALLMIAGRGHLGGELEARAAALGLQDSVRFLGYVPDDILPLVYAAADISVVPTVALEGFGLITIESLAAGTPVLVTPVGGLPEAVSRLHQDLVLEGTGAKCIARGVIDALTGNRILPDASACHAYARRYYDWPVVAAQVADVYAEVAR